MQSKVYCIFTLEVKPQRVAEVALCYFRKFFQILQKLKIRKNNLHSSNKALERKSKTYISRKGSTLRFYSKQVFWDNEIFQKDTISFKKYHFLLNEPITLFLKNASDKFFKIPKLQRGKNMKCSILHFPYHFQVKWLPPFINSKISKTLMWANWECSRGKI